MPSNPGALALGEIEGLLSKQHFDDGRDGYHVWAVAYARGIAAWPERHRDPPGTNKRSRIH